MRAFAVAVILFCIGCNSQTPAGNQKMSMADSLGPSFKDCDTANRICRYRYAVNICRYLTKKYSYNIYFDPWYGAENPMDELILASDAFHVEVNPDTIYAEISPEMRRLGFKYLHFISKSKDIPKRSGYYGGIQYIAGHYKSMKI